MFSRLLLTDQTNLWFCSAGNEDEVNKHVIYGVCAGSFIVFGVLLIALGLVLIAKKKNSNHPAPLKEETFPELLVHCS